MISVLIPTKNNTRTIKAVLDRLGFQGVNLKVLIIDNNSKDGTKELIEYWIKNKIFPFELKFIDGVEFAQGRYAEIPYSRYKLIQEADTEELFFLDSDVLLPPNAILQAKEFFEKTENAGFIGIDYEPLNLHVQIGAGYTKKSMIQDIDFYSNNQTGLCICHVLRLALEKKDLKMEYHPHLTAYHIRFL